MSKNKPRLLTGLRPTNDLHIGNYVGAIAPMVKAQDDYEVFMCIVDLHAIVTPYEPKELPEAIKNNALDYLAAGIDPHKSALFIQSHVPEHVELMWLLNTLTPVGELQRMTQYKDFTERYGEPMAGVLNYPILMAADILLYKAQAVPVGEDQNQHLELTRTIARKFNNQYGETFTLPDTISPDSGARLMSLNDPSKKMSKSLGPKSYIALSDDESTIRKKIGSAVTDVGEKSDEMGPGVKNLFELLKLTDTTETYSHMLTKYNEGNLQYSELKPVVADSIIEYLKPLQKKRKDLEKNLDHVAKALAKGAEQAREIAAETIKEVKDKMGLQ